MEEQTNKVKFYADCPDGTTNKLFVFKDIKTVSHAVDILVKFLRQGYIIRASFYEFLSVNGEIKNSKISHLIKDIDLLEYQTYSEKVKEKFNNTIIN
jgi:hypothetical protein